MEAWNQAASNRHKAFRNRWEKIETPVGQVKALRPPVTTEDIDIVMNPVPEIGEHTESILREFGLTERC